MINDIIEAFKEDRCETLTASISIWANEQLQKIGDLRHLSREEAETVVFGEQDFFDGVFEGVFGLSMADYPELRDIQHDYIDSQIEA